MELQDAGCRRQSIGSERCSAWPPLRDQRGSREEEQALPEVHGIARFAVTPCNGFPPSSRLMGGHTGMDPFAPAFFSLLPKFKVVEQ